MSVEQRLTQIADYVLERGEALIDELVDQFGVSRMTIHRHVEELARQEILRKLHGAVSAQPTGVYESLFSFRKTWKKKQKDLMARTALDEFEPSQAVLIDDSTSANALAPYLSQKVPIKIITNILGLTNAVSENPDISLLCLGGNYHPTHNAFIGHLCEKSLEQIQVNTFLCSSSAISNGLAMIQDQQVARVKQAMVRAAKEKILRADAGKFGKAALHRFAPLSAYN